MHEQAEYFNRNELKSLPISTNNNIIVDKIDKKTSQKLVHIYKKITHQIEFILFAISLTNTMQ